MATDSEDKQGVTSSIDTPNPAEARYGSGNKSQSSDERYDNEAESSESLREQEDSAGNSGEGNASYDDNQTDSESKLGKGFNPVDDRSKIRVVAKVLVGNKKKLLIGGGVGGGIAGLLIFAFLSILPLKVLHIVNNIQDQFFAGTEQATEDIGDNLFRQYLVTKVIPGMVAGKCNSTRASKSCAAVNNTANPVSALYLTWKNARLEGQLYDRHGIEIVREGNKFFYRSDNLRERIFLGDYTESNSRVFENRAFSQLSRNEIRREMRTALETETIRKRIMYRYSVGNLLEKKYGIKRCLLACTARDNRQDKIEARRAAFKSYLSERVLAPRSEAMALALECSFNGFKCTDVGESDVNGERRSQYEIDLQTRLQDYRSRFGSTSLDDLQTEADRISEKGFTNYLMRKIAGETAAKTLTRAIPIVGWLDMGARLISGAGNIGPSVRKMNYVMNTTAMVSMFAMARTSADEIKVANPDLDSVGSIADSYNSNPLNDQNGAAAEESPLYRAIMEGNTAAPNVATALFPTVAAASSATNSGYKCDDGKPVPNSKLVCSESSFDSTSKVGKVADEISKIANGSAVSFFLGTPAAIYLNTIGKLFDLAGAAFGKVLGFLSPVDLSSIISWAQDKIFTRIFVNPVTEKPSGARTFEMNAGGADVAANEYAHYGQGAPRASQQQVNDIRLAQAFEREYDFNKKPLYARLFDTSTSASLVSKVALSMPSSPSRAGISISNKALNPIGSMVSSFSAMFPSPKANAATSFTADPFGIDQYAWPLDHPVFSQDVNLEKYWDEQGCSDPDQLKKWGDKGIIDPATLIVSHTEANPCILMRIGSETSGGKYDSSLIKSGAAENGQAIPTPSAQVGLPGDIYGASDQKKCEIGQDGGIQDGYRKGNLVPIRLCILNGIDINVSIEKNLDALLKAAKADGITFTGGGFRTMEQQRRLYRELCIIGDCKPPAAKPGFSGHQMGLAIDFTYNDEPRAICYPKRSSSCQGHPGFEWLEKNAAKFGLKNLPSEAWHWSVDGG